MYIQNILYTTYQFAKYGMRWTPQVQMHFFSYPNPSIGVLSYRPIEKTSIIPFESNHILKCTQKPVSNFINVCTENFTSLIRASNFFSIHIRSHVNSFCCCSDWQHDFQFPSYGGGTAENLLCHSHNEHIQAGDVQESHCSRIEVYTKQRIFFITYDSWVCVWYFHQFNELYPIIIVTD